MNRTLGQHILRGCGCLKHCGYHPGWVPLVLMLLLGTFIGGIVGAVLLGAPAAALFLWGARERSLFEDKFDATLREGNG